MQLKIVERLHPFSHQPGISCLIPETPYVAQFFPCLIRLSQFKAHQPTKELLKEFELHLQGPIEQWTVCQDLEKKRISVWGVAKEGWFRFHISQALVLILERAPLNGLKISQGQQTVLLQAKESFSLIPQLVMHNISPQIDRLSLGSHRLQEWGAIKKRLDLTEILPIWHRLGQMTPVLETSSFQESGILNLLQVCEENCLSGKPEEGKGHWLNLFRAGFEGLLVPRLLDTDYQGIVKNSLLPSLSPLVLLTEGAKIIRHLFIQKRDQTLLILPHLLPELHAGRLLDVSLKEQGQISLEWTKKTIRRLIFFSSIEQSLTFQFRSNVRSFRLRQNLLQKGKRMSCGQPLLFKENQYYFFDNFE